MIHQPSPLASLPEGEGDITQHYGHLRNPILDVVLNTLLPHREGRGMRAMRPDLNALIKNGEDIERYSLICHDGLF